MNSMSENGSDGIISDPQLDNMCVDSEGVLISGVRMEVAKAYSQIPVLLQKFINNDDITAWRNITNRIDYIYSNLDHALSALDKETAFGKKVRLQVMTGKKLLFKPNLVSPSIIDPETHGEGTGTILCTEWPLVAALMRWFHDKLHIKYFQMTLGEGSASTFLLSDVYSKMAGRKVTTEAILEGRSGNFYGGWGFYFVRKYLAAHRPFSNEDNPMNGYEESVEGKFLAPGSAGDRLMLYDLNKIQDDRKKGRTVVVPEGANFKEITLHKAIIGGDSRNKQDMEEYPGCILINIPKLKMHSQDLITNAIKNIGIGLYPSQCAEQEDKNSTSWKYAYPPTNNPNLKGKLPHSPWVLKMDESTRLPAKDENGKYIATKTAGLSGTEADVIRAIQNQNVFMIHIVDSIHVINLSHDNAEIAVRVPEGFVWASLDCVALDLFCSRYCFKNVSMAEALKLKERNNWITEFVQRVPVAKVLGTNIITEEGVDSPLFRYDLYRYAEQRGIGQQKYHIIGWDSLTKTPMVSLSGHLGTIEKGKFLELITKTRYYNPITLLHHFQVTVLSYAKACDRLTGSSIFNEFMELFDENQDSIIDYDEKGRGTENAFFSMSAYAMEMIPSAAYGVLKGNFILALFFMKYSDRNWNPQGHNFSREREIVEIAATAYNLSKANTVSADRFILGMTYGMGMWPSWQTAQYVKLTNYIYGTQVFQNIKHQSLYGLAFQYADKVQNKGIYTGSINENVSSEDSIHKYFEALSKGAQSLGFTFYVPKGYGSLEKLKIPNVEETTDPQKIFTVSFTEIW